MDDSSHANTPPARAHTKGLPLFIRLLASSAVVALVGTFVATEIDFIRRHRPGVSPEAFLVPQALQILAPGIGLAAAFGTCAAVAAYRHRTKAGRS
jgi:hypothetical protein